MSFFLSLCGVSITNREKSSAIQEKLKVELLLLLSSRGANLGGLDIWQKCYPEILSWWEMFEHVQAGGEPLANRNRAREIISQLVRNSSACWGSRKRRERRRKRDVWAAVPRGSNMASQHTKHRWSFIEAKQIEREIMHLNNGKPGTVPALPVTLRAFHIVWTKEGSLRVLYKTGFKKANRHKFLCCICLLQQGFIIFCLCFKVPNIFCFFSSIFCPLKHYTSSLHGTVFLIPLARLDYYCLALLSVYTTAPLIFLCIVFSSI